MSITNYTNLKTTLAAYLNREDLTAYLGDFINLAESRLNKELRVREMVSIDTSIDTVSGTQSFITNIILHNLQELQTSLQ